MLDKQYVEDFYFDFLQLQYSYYKKSLAQPDKMVLKDIGFFSELILGAGLNPVMLEVLIGMIPAHQLEKQVKSKAEGYIYDMGICSFNKYAFPVFDSKVYELPLAFTCTTVCQEVSSSFSLMVQKYKKPGFYVDIPYGKSKESLKYVEDQYKEIFKKLCEIQNQPTDIDKLREYITQSNQALDYIRKGNELRKNARALIYGGQMLKFTYIISLLGLKSTIEVAKKYYYTCKQKIASEEFVETEKHRILWCNTGVMYDDEFYQYIERELGAVIIFEELNSITWDAMDEKNPFLAFAQRAFCVDFIGDINNRISNLLKLVEDYAVDGVIFFQHQNCRLFNLRANQIIDALNQKGVPVLELSGDSFDNKNYSKEQLLTRIEAFVEMLD